MAGTVIGGKSAAKTNKLRHGESFYADIGRLGGKKSRLGGWASEKIGKDGLTGPQRASIAGRKGGLKSRKSKSQSQ